MLPRYLYSVTWSKAWLLKNSLTCSNLPNNIYLVFTVFTIDLFLAQNEASPFSWLCAFCAVVEAMIRSSDQRKWTKISSSAKMVPVFSFRYCLKSDRYLQKIMGLAFPPWFTPTSCNKPSLIKPPCLTWKNGPVTSDRVYFPIVSSR